MTNNPLFSVLIAQYNNGKYLQEAIDSVKAQTYANWEIILVDDASTDNSHELYKLYKDDDRIKIYHNEENKGCGYTKRRCAELANGEICGFLDPDDALLPEALQLMVEKHLQDRKISLVHSKLIYCNENLQQMSIYLYAKKIDDNIDYLHTNRGAVTHFASFKKIFYDKTIGIDANFLRAVDQDLYYKMEEVGLLCFIDKPLYLYRLHEGGISTNVNSLKAFFWHMKAIDNACQRRNINDAEIIFSDLVFSDIIKPNLDEVTRINNEFSKKINSPTFRFVLKIIYKYIGNTLKYFNKKEK